MRGFSTILIAVAVTAFAAGCNEDGASKRSNTYSNTGTNTQPNTNTSGQPSVNPNSGQNVNKTLNNSQSAIPNSDGVKRISVEDAKKAFDKKSAVIVDTRPVDSYQLEHIKGSINIPLAEFENRFRELPPEKLVIAYCS